MNINKMLKIFLLSLVVNNSKCTICSLIKELVNKESCLTDKNIINSMKKQFNYLIERIKENSGYIKIHEEFNEDGSLKNELWMKLLKIDFQDKIYFYAEILEKSFHENCFNSFKKYNFESVYNFRDKKVGKELIGIFTLDKQSFDNSSYFKKRDIISNYLNSNYKKLFKEIIGIDLMDIRFF